KNMAYLHAATETAPGHASLFSGRTPREHRIVANEVWRSDLKRRGSLLEDPAARVVSAEGVDPRSTGVSLANVRGQMLADALRERDPKSVVVALSLKDRGAVFAAGRSPTAALWYSEATGKLVTSSAFAKDGKLPAFALPYATVVQPNAPLSWSIFDRAFVEAHQQTPDDLPGESSLFAGSRTFPHEMGGAPAFLGFRFLPEADALLVDLAIASLGLRQPEHPMLLAVSFSTNDLVGHLFGPTSWEAWSELASLDAQLARLFRGLDAALGPEGYSVVLSGDHGIVPTPEFVKVKQPDYCVKGTDYYERPCVPGMRVVPATLEKLLNTSLQPLLGSNEPSMLPIIDSRIILTDAARALPPIKQKAFDQRLQVLARQDPSVAAVFPIRELPEECPAASDETLRALVCRANTEPAEGFFDVPGDYYVVLKPGRYWGAADGAGHGAPYRYDREVPLLVRYPGGPRERVVEHATFGSYYASVWYALTGEVTGGPYGSVIGAR
ncbi:MAG TPA: alkaline phosphatase family protein, partial [Polyangiaceae bacterium]|nr:alkaline phosphatase family protein [Polyangiaceae bacterium]